MGVELISTGGTAKLLRDNQIPVREVAEITGFPEMLDGRVKTIHPRIAGGILAVRANAEHMRALAEHDIPPIQMVVVNLYAFEKYANKPGVTREELIENIDIGGPTMIRAAAKNFQDVAVVVSPAQYDPILERAGQQSRELELCYSLASSRSRPFSIPPLTIRPSPRACSQIDAAGQTHRRRNCPPRFAFRRRVRPFFAMAKTRIRKPRSTSSMKRGIAGAEQLHGKELSYNNLVDLDAAWQLMQEFDSPPPPSSSTPIHAVARSNPTLSRAYRKALEADPVSAFGGVLAFNRELDNETAAEVAQAVRRSDRRPAFSAGCTGRSDREEESASGASEANREAGAGDQIHLRRPAGANADYAPTHEPDASSEDHAAAHRRRDAGAAFRLEGLQARKVERDRLRARRTDRSASAPDR